MIIQNWNISKTVKATITFSKEIQASVCRKSTCFNPGCTNLASQFSTQISKYSVQILLQPEATNITLLIFFWLRRCSLLERFKSEFQPALQVLFSCALYNGSGVKAYSFFRSILCGFRVRNANHSIPLELSIKPNLVEENLRNV